MGIYPRFVEPNLLSLTHLKVPLKGLHRDLEGLNILQLSDLHIGRRSSSRFLKRLQRRIQKTSADLIVVTGDFLCNSAYHSPDLLSPFLRSLEAPLGCFCILGNHDYSHYVGLRGDGKLHVRVNNRASILQGFRHLLFQTKSSHFESTVQGPIPLHERLCQTLESCGIQLLHNDCVQISRGRGVLNLAGLADLWSGHFDPDAAFSKYQKDFPGIILSHNPDSVDKLKDWPGDLILCGHTHGGQVNLPFLWRRLCSIQNSRYKRGRFGDYGKEIYVNRGLGSTVPFRFASIPELTLIELQKSL